MRASASDSSRRGRREPGCTWPAPLTGAPGSGVPPAPAEFSPMLWSPRGEVPRVVSAHWRGCWEVLIGRGQPRGVGHSGSALWVDTPTPSLSWGYPIRPTCPWALQPDWAGAAHSLPHSWTGGKWRPSGPPPPALVLAQWRHWGCPRPLSSLCDWAPWKWCPLSMVDSHVPGHRLSAGRREVGTHAACIFPRAFLIPVFI